MNGMFVTCCHHRCRFHYFSDVNSERSNDHGSALATNGALELELRRRRPSRLRCPHLVALLHREKQARNADTQR